MRGRHKSILEQIALEFEVALHDMEIEKCNADHPVFKKYNLKWIHHCMGNNLNVMPGKKLDVKAFHKHVFRG